MAKQTSPKQVIDTGPPRKGAGQKPVGNPKRGGKIFGNWQDRHKQGPRVPV